MKLSATMTLIWGFGFAILLASGAIDSIDLEKASHLTLTIGSLLIVCVGIPAFRDPDLRHPLSLFYMALGLILLGAAAALVVFVFAMFFLSSWNIGSHR